MKAKETVDYTIKSSWHAISRMYNAQAIKHDMTAAIGYVLLNINLENGTPATKIAPALGLETRSLTRMLKSMEEKGLIYRVTDAKDKRGVNIYLTEEGKHKREIARRTVIDFNKLVKDHVKPEKLNTFFEVIHEINKLIEESKTYPIMELKKELSQK